MKIINNNLSFKSKPQNMADYYNTLIQGKEKAGNKGKSILIVPSSNLPQISSNNTGVGYLGSEDGLKFLEFAKKIWGINEIQILPSGQYHFHDEHVPMYSGTSMDLGNHMINIKSHATQEEFEKIVKSNHSPNIVNYKNIIKPHSIQENVLREIYLRADKTGFEQFKKENSFWLDSKAIYRALRDEYQTANYHNWPDIDKNLFSLAEEDRNKRIEEISEKLGKEIDFYKFKQFLAENDLKKTKEELNSKGLKLNGDLICGFSYDEVWANPKAFRANDTIGWGLPALNFENPEAEKLLRDKVRLYAKRFDGIRIDASWTYINQPSKAGKRYYGDKYLNIIDEEVKKVKGAGYDLKNIMHEFIMSNDEFNIYEGDRLRPYIEKRNKIYTSDWLNSSWGSNKSFLLRGWKPECFVLGVTNHDSKEMKVNEEQAEVLSKILKIPKDKLMSQKEFIKAKFAEPMSAFNNMLFFKDALGLKSWKDKIPSDYEDIYFKALEEGEGFNPMDALEKTFKAQGLDKKDPKLYKKIVKYKKILEGKKSSSGSAFKWVIGAACAGLLIYGLVKYYSNTSHKNN